MSTLLSHSLRVLLSALVVTWTPAWCCCAWAEAAAAPEAPSADACCRPAERQATPAQPPMTVHQPAPHAGLAAAPAHVPHACTCDLDARSALAPRESQPPAIQLSADDLSSSPGAAPAELPPPSKHILYATGTDPSGGSADSSLFARHCLLVI